MSCRYIYRRHTKIHLQKSSVNGKGCNRRENQGKTMALASEAVYGALRSFGVAVHLLVEGHAEGIEGNEISDYPPDKQTA